MGGGQDVGGGHEGTGDGAGGSLKALYSSINTMMITTMMLAHLTHLGMDGIMCIPPLVCDIRDAGAPVLGRGGGCDGEPPAGGANAPPAA